MRSETVAYTNPNLSLTIYGVHELDLCLCTLTPSALTSEASATRENKVSPFESLALNPQPSYI